MTKAKIPAQKPSTPKKPSVSPAQRKQLIQMNWDEAGTFDKARAGLKLTSTEFVKLMKELVTPKDFRRWKAQVEAQGALKAESKKSHRAPRR